MSVELSNTRTDLIALAQDLNFSVTLLYKWRKEFSSKQGSTYLGDGEVILSSVEQELANLKKSYLKREWNGIFSKKPLAFFLGATTNIQVHKVPQQNIFS